MTMTPSQRAYVENSEKQLDRMKALEDTAKGEGRKFTPEEVAEWKQLALEVITVGMTELENDGNDDAERDVLLAVGAKLREQVEALEPAELPL